MKSIFFLLFLFTFSISCDRYRHRHREPLAKAHDKYLFREDIKNIFPKNISYDDSIKIARNYIDNWIRDQLFLRLAEINLPDEEKDLDKKIEEFRTSLLIHKYQQFLVNEKIDLNIPVEEIEDYYNNHSDNFILNRTAIRGLYSRIPIDAPNRDRMLDLFRRGNDYLQIENFVNQYDGQTIWFHQEDNWVYLDDIKGYFPDGTFESRINFNNTDHIVATDNEYYYFLGITDFREPRGRMPFSLAAQDIRRILMNRKKMNYLRELEANLMKEGLSKNLYQYY